MSCMPLRVLRKQSKMRLLLSASDSQRRNFARTAGLGQASLTQLSPQWITSRRQEDKNDSILGRRRNGAVPENVVLERRARAQRMLRPSLEQRVLQSSQQQQKPLLVNPRLDSGKPRVTTASLLTQQQQQQQHPNQQRLFSTQPQRQPPAPTLTVPLPTKHSIQQPPPVCKDDRKAIIDTIQQDILNVPIGHLIKYQPVQKTIPKPKKYLDNTDQAKEHLKYPHIDVAQDRAMAWDAADVIIQKAEFLLRGLAAQVPGTLTWKQEALRGADEYWPAGGPRASPALDQPGTALTEIVPVMLQVLERLNEEGLAYMQVRAQRLAELYPIPLPGQEEQQEEEAIQRLWDSAEGTKDLLLTEGQDAAQKAPEEFQNIMEFGTEEDFHKEVDLNDFDGLSPEEMEQIQQQAGAGETIARSEQAMKASGFDMQGPVPSAVDRNQRLTAEQLQFLGVMQQNGDGANQDTTWSQLSNEQQQILEFLACSSPTMSEEKEQELVDKEKLQEDLYEARVYQAKQPKPDPFKVEKTRWNFTPLEEEEQEKEKKKQEMTTLLETYDDGLTDEERQLQDFENQFASPGPTIDMYNLVLDCMAVTASNVKDPYALVYHTDVLHPRNVEFLFEQAMCRHELDGGDGTNYFLPRNDNVYTVPNIVTFNAPLRLCASLPYENPSVSSDSNTDGKPKSFLESVSSFMDPKELIFKMQRDEALVAAMFTFDRLTHCRVVRWSPASFAYMIQLCGKYLPVPSEMRGNVSVALFANCFNEGLVDGFVVRQVMAANEPSNGKDIDEFLAKHGVPMPNVETPPEEETDSETKPKKVPHRKRQDLAGQYGTFSPRYTRNARPRRHLDYDSTY